MKKFKLFILLSLLTQSLLLNGQDADPTHKDFNREFEKNAIPGSFEEISFTREKLILLKKYEPITEEKVKALIYLRVISKTQGSILSTKHDNKGIIFIPDLEKALKEKNVQLSLVQKVLTYFPGPFTVEVLNKMVILEIITKDEKDIITTFVTPDGYLPGVPPEQPVIVVKDTWEGIPLNSFGMIDTEQMLNDLFKNNDLSKLQKLIEKHQTLLIEFDDISSPKNVTSVKDVKKARQKQEKEMKSLLDRMIPVEKDIAKLRDLMALLYLEGVMQNRYDSTFGLIKNIDRDSATLIQCLLKESNGKNKTVEITSDRCALSPKEKFICIDKTLLWLQNSNTIFHKKLAENVLKIVMENIGHPPFDAPADMWIQWWQMQQKKIYKQVAGPTPAPEKQ
jgi:hypothetical protein